ncbi:MAG TPA: SDR family NAD(P)-dependent oxidoreductase [Acidimicrobiia bacterium]|nr:SDR family NAD(P)-dependent oxidoreductase [Acidimicrobiia bacterium]
MSLAGKVAIVTGGTGALGRAVTRLFLAEGADVTVTSRRPAERDALAAQLPVAARDRLHAVAADVTDAASVGRLVTEVTTRTGRLDVLVNVAGGFAAGDLLATDETVWDRMLALNLASAYLCCRAALPAMIAAGGGRIVNVGSRSVVPPQGGFIAYTVAKAGVIALTQALAHEVRRHRVTVNAVLPSTMDTEANRQAMPGADPSQWVTPESVAAAIAFLASDAAAGVTGSLVAV